MKQASNPTSIQGRRTRARWLDRRIAPAAAAMRFRLLGLMPLLFAPFAQAQTIVTQDLVLTGDHVGPLWVYTSGITVDCQQYRVIEPYPVDQDQQNQPGNGRAGILLDTVSDVTIKNCNVEDFWFGIQVLSGMGITLINNSVSETATPSNGWTVRDAFSVLGSSDTVLIGNTEADTNGDGFVLVGSSNNFLSGNEAGGPGSAYGLLSAHDNNLQNNAVTGNGGGDGFYIHESNGNRLIANAVSGQVNGFKVQTGSSGNTIRANAITDNTRGILVCAELRNTNSLSPNRFGDNDADIVEGTDEGGCL